MDAFFFIPVGSVHASNLLVELFRWTKRVFTKAVMVDLKVTLGSKSGSAEGLLCIKQDLSTNFLKMNRDGTIPISELLATIEK